MKIGSMYVSAIFCGNSYFDQFKVDKNVVTFLRDGMEVGYCLLTDLSLMANWPDGAWRLPTNRFFDDWCDLPTGS